jgi:hypothetical protein
VAVKVEHIGDENLEPWKEDGITDSEVTELFKSDTAPMVTKEPAHG